MTLGVLVAFLRDERRTAVYKVPKQPMLLPPLPHHSVGKVLQRKSRARFEPSGSMT